MKKQILTIVIIIIILTIGLSGCEEDTTKLNEQRIIGTWFGSELFQGSTKNITIIFSSNKTFETIGVYKGDTITGIGTYRIIKDKLEIDITEPNPSASISNYNFSNNFNTLTIIDSTGAKMDFTRQ